MPDLAKILPGIDTSKIAAEKPPPWHPQYGVFYADLPRERSILAVGIICIVVAFFVTVGRLYLNAFGKGRKLSADDGEKQRLSFS